MLENRNKNRSGWVVTMATIVSANLIFLVWVIDYCNKKYKYRIGSCTSVFTGVPPLNKCAFSCENKAVVTSSHRAKPLVVYNVQYNNLYQCVNIVFVLPYTPRKTREINLRDSSIHVSIILPWNLKTPWLHFFLNELHINPSTLNIYLV